jgi:hypothetical protein
MTKFHVAGFRMAVNAGCVFYALLCGSIIIGLVVILSRSPLFPFQLENNQWLRDWLGFTVRLHINVIRPL